MIIANAPAANTAHNTTTAALRMNCEVLRRNTMRFFPKPNVA